MPRSLRSSAIVTTVVMIAVSLALVVRAGRPPSVIPASAADTTFSAERAMQHVRRVAERPHPAGSIENAAVRDYLVAELERLGLEVGVQRTTAQGTRYDRSGPVENVVARLRGTSTSGRAVLLASHYDSRDGAPGAGDAASAVGALVETMRALRSGARLEHDVILLLTDAEETGLLGAAAFVREHPWARDVEVALNFEARGTGGRVFMFETAPGNLDVVRVLRDVPEVSATSLMVMVYRVLPNDTDLTELMALGRPSMNFAFIDGVERYHTALDDVAHLDQRSVQHHGVQALALARAFASGPLPRPATGDAVFFDVPFMGLIVYPEPLAWIPAGLALLLAGLLLVRRRRATRHPFRDVVLGASGSLIAIVLGAVAASALALGLAWLHVTLQLDGRAAWPDAYAAAVVAAAGGTSWGMWRLVRRMSPTDSAHAGALAALAVVAALVTWLARGASYVLVWPVLLATVAALARPARTGVRQTTRWVSSLVTLTFLVPLVFLLGVAMGIQLPGAAAAGLLTAAGVWLLAPHLDAGSSPAPRDAGGGTDRVRAAGVRPLGGEPRAPVPDTLLQ